MGVAFDAAVVNQFNRNDDGIDSETAVQIAPYFIHKPTNIEHKKQRVVGHIVNSAFSSYGENKILSDETFPYSFVSLPLDSLIMFAILPTLADEALPNFSPLFTNFPAALN